ncbi:recombinase family protein [Carnobacterium maltaromaticum]|uniref:recombinase family protein n=1 Tax=Carnobacterium maltaromaticum TaxID=2751 RepID=UPI00295E79BE|nr:recombinase family protein [Carnobacterium maltaromaticum]
MAIIGYMRVSTHHQKFDSQLVALKKYGVTKIYKEYESGRKLVRSELTKALNALKPNDTFVIFKLDRLARSTSQLLNLLEDFNKRDIHFISIQNNIDTSTYFGKFFFTIMAAFSEMEVNLTRERIMSGLEAARVNGTILGRPTLSEETKKALLLYSTTNLSVKEIANECAISVSTLYNHIRKQEKIAYRKKKTQKTGDF